MQYKNYKSAGDALVALSILAAMAAGAVSLFKWKLWLAGTQWMLIATVLAIYALYLAISSKK